MPGTHASAVDSVPNDARARMSLALPSFASRLNSADWFFVALPCLVMLAALGACCLADVDVATSRLFYDEEFDEWPVGEAQPWKALYEFGCRPSVWIGVAGLVVGFLSYLVAAARPFRKNGFFLALTLALGPGILVNAILKPSVGRPRPCQTVAFGGEHQFAYCGGAAEANKSFPSGHASMGFYLMTPALILYRRRPKLAAAVFFAGLSYGCLIGFARVVQGAHFVTDVVASALFVYASGVSVLVLLRQVRDAPSRTQNNRPAGRNAEPILTMPAAEPAARPTGRRAA